MRIFVINLDRSPDRLAYMRDQLHGMGLAFERVRAVDGLELDEDELRRHGDLAPTETACFLSHRRAWEGLLRSDENLALVLEDDTIMSAALAHYVTDENWFPQYASVVKVEAPRFRAELRAKGERIAGGRKLHQLLKYVEGSAAYIVSRKARGSCWSDPKE